MGEIVVPVDLTREEKEVLGMISLRQFFYIFPSALFAFVFALFIPLPIESLVTKIVVKSIVVVLVLGAGAALSFIRLPKYEIGLDTFIKLNMRYKREQQEFF